MMKINVIILSLCFLFFSGCYYLFYDYDSPDAVAMRKSAEERAEIKKQKKLQKQKMQSKSSHQVEDNEEKL